MQLESCEERIEVLLVGGARHSLRDRTLNSFKAMHFSPPPPCRGKNLPSSYDIFTGSTIHTQHLTIQGLIEEFLAGENVFDCFATATGCFVTPRKKYLVEIIKCALHLVKIFLISK